MSRREEIQRGLDAQRVALKEHLSREMGIDLDEYILPVLRVGEDLRTRMYWEVDGEFVAVLEVPDLLGRMP